MLRNVSLPFGLVAIISSLAALGLAQDHAGSRGQTVPSRPSIFRPADSNPAAIPVGKNSATNLADRLKAIRGTVTSEYNGSTPSNARTPVENRAAAPVAMPDNEGTSQLPSVLVRRGGDAPLAPVVSPSQQKSLGGEPPETVAEPLDENDPTESTRRTVRRFQREPTTYQPPVTFHATPDTTSTQLSLSTQGPVMSIETLGPKAIAVGKASNYQVRLINQGTASADRVVVTVTLPNSVEIVSTQARAGSANESNDRSLGQRVVWELERVAARSEQELSLSLKPTENRPIDLRVDWMFRPAALEARIEVQQPQLAMVVEGPSEMRYGETKIFKVRVSNPGNGPAENVTVNIGATGVATQPNSIGTLPAGESRTMEVELTAKQPGVMQIEAAARGDSDLKAESTHEVRVRRAELAVKVSAPELLYAGTTATYQIRVANRGDAVAEEVLLQLELPPGVKNAIGVDKKPVTTDPPRWRLGDLAPGTDRVYTLQCDLTTGGRNQLTARVQATDNSAAQDVALTMVEAIADLKLIVNDPKGPIAVGKDVTYEIQVINRGSKEATNIDLVAQFSDGIEPSSATGHRSQLMPGQVVFDPIASLPAGEQLTVKITARAQVSGNLLFRAELKCQDPETKLVMEESTRFYGSATPGTDTSSAGQPTPTPARR